MNFPEMEGNDDSIRMLLQNQRTIIEQNVKIIEQQAQLRRDNQNDNDGGNGGREKVPSAAKVS